MPALNLVYDNNGNRTNLSFDAFGETNTYLPNSNQLTSQGSSSITRDTAGNRTSDNKEKPKVKPKGSDSIETHY